MSRRRPRVYWQGAPDAALVAQQHETLGFVVEGCSPELEAGGVKVLVLPWLVDSDPHDRASPIPAAAPARSTWPHTIDTDGFGGSWCPVQLERGSPGELVVTVGPLVDAGLFHVAVLCDGAHAENSPFACDVLPHRPLSRAASPFAAPQRAASPPRSRTPPPPLGYGGGTSAYSHHSSSTHAHSSAYSSVHASRPETRHSPLPFCHRAAPAAGARDGHRRGDGAAAAAAHWPGDK